MKHFNKLFIMLAFIGLSVGSISAQYLLPQSGNLSGTYTASGNYSGPYTLTGNTTIRVESGTATITGVINGSSSYYLAKAGAGKLILAGVNIYNGITYAD
ncbi:MAG: hypothetical protein FWH59_03720, partial [Lentimicrobiaceae bacterium]|nr:hypothetical protein [Lentimicrobiaceae bacterium]